MEESSQVGMEKQRLREADQEEGTEDTTDLSSCSTSPASSAEEPCSASASANSPPDIILSRADRLIKLNSSSGSLPSFNIIDAQRIDLAERRRWSQENAGKNVRSTKGKRPDSWKPSSISRGSGSSLVIGLRDKGYSSGSDIASSPESGTSPPQKLSSLGSFPSPTPPLDDRSRYRPPSAGNEVDVSVSPPPSMKRVALVGSDMTVSACRKGTEQGSPLPIMVYRDKPEGRQRRRRSRSDAHNMLLQAQRISAKLSQTKSKTGKLSSRRHSRSETDLMQFAEECGASELVRSRREQIKRKQTAAIIQVTKAPPPPVTAESKPSTENNAPYYSIFDNREEDVMIELDTAGTQQVVAASLQKLCNILADERVPDMAYTDTFLATFRRFLSPKTLWDKWKKRFLMETVPEHVSADESMLKVWNEKKPKVRVRLINVIKRWIEQYKSDFMIVEDEDAEPLMEDVRRFRDYLKSPECNDDDLRRWLPMLQRSIDSLLGETPIARKRTNASNIAKPGEEARLTDQKEIVLNEMSISDIMELSCIALRQIAQRMKSEITSNKKVQSRTMFKTHKNCFVGRDALEWLSTCCEDDYSLVTASLSMQGSNSDLGVESPRFVQQSSCEELPIFTKEEDPEEKRLPIFKSILVFEKMMENRLVVEVLRVSPKTRSVDVNSYYRFVHLIEHAPDQHSLLTVTPTDMAFYLTKLDHGVFCDITFREIEKKAWSGKQKQTVAPNITYLTQRANRTSYWVASEVVSVDNSKGRAKLIKRFIQIGMELKRLNNFNTLIQIVSGLRLVSGLKKSWRLLLKKSLSQYDTLKALFVPANNFQAYRDELQRVSEPCNPYLGLFLQDLTFIEDANPDFMEDGRVNFRKCRLLAGVYSKFKQYQATAYKATSSAKILDDALLVAEEVYENGQVLTEKAIHGKLKTLEKGPAETG